MTRHTIWIAALSALTLVGCEDKSATPPVPHPSATPTGSYTTPAPTPTSDISSSAANTAADAKAAADKAAADAAKSAADAKDAAAKAVEDAKVPAITSTPATPATPAAPTTPSVPATTAGATAAPADATAKATSLLQQAIQYIKDNKLDLANGTLKQLDGMKGSLPASFGEKIDQAKSLLAAKQAESMFK